QLYVPKNSRITPEINLLRAYVRIDTSNPPGREMGGARFLADLLEKHGLKAEIIESAPGRANVYARLPGKRRGEGLLLLNHIDVVPATSVGWFRPPFEAAIALNQLWGRGSLDMKSIALCELEGLFAAARRAASNCSAFVCRSNRICRAAIPIAFFPKSGSICTTSRRSESSIGSCSRTSIARWLPENSGFSPRATKS